MCLKKCVLILVLNFMVFKKIVLKTEVIEKRKPTRSVLFNYLGCSVLLKITKKPYLITLSPWK